MPADFFDSNVLIYYFSREPNKAGRAAELLEKGCTVSVQVLNEVVNVHRRKLRMDWPRIHDMLTLLHAATERILPLTRPTTISASRSRNVTTWRPTTP